MFQHSLMFFVSVTFFFFLFVCIQQKLLFLTNLTLYNNNKFASFFFVSYIHIVSFYLLTNPTLCNKQVHNYKIYVNIYAIMKVKNLCKVCLIITVDSLYLATAILGIAHVVCFCSRCISASTPDARFFTGFFFTFTIF